MPVVLKIGCEAMVLLFISAVLGAALVEVYEARDYFRSGNHRLPRRYYRFSFYFWMILAILGAGGAALILPLNKNPYLAFIFGAAAPRVIYVLIKKATVLLRHI